MYKICIGRMQDVYKMYTRCIQVVLKICTRRIRDVFKMFSRCMQNTRCIQDVYKMCMMFLGEYKACSLSCTLAVTSSTKLSGNVRACG